MVHIEKIEHFARTSVLAWLATSDISGQANVSPKELFVYHSDRIIIANVASPQSLRNVKMNEKVCVSLLDILEQKGIQIKGTCTIISKDDPSFETVAQPLTMMAQGKYPFNELFVITPTSTKDIIAPSYYLFPDEAVADKIKAAKKSYGLD